MVADPYTCVVFEENKGILIQGASGSGKSTLALCLIREHGATLVADDYVQLINEQNRLSAHAPQHTQGLLEIRHIGIVSFPHTAKCTIICVIHLLPEQQCSRIPESEEIAIMGVQCPIYQLPERSSLTALKVKILVEAL